MRIHIAITAYDRLDLFEQCIRSVKASAAFAQKRFLMDEECEIEVVADRNEDSDEFAEINRISGECWMVNGTHKDSPLGADLNILRSLQFVGNSIDEDVYAIKLDSDVIVGKNFVHDMVVLAMHSKGMATSNLYGRDPLNVKLENCNNITRWAMSGANFCIHADHLERILPMATALIKTYKQNGHNPATTAEEWRVMKDLLRLYAPLHNPDNSPHRDFLLNSDVPNTGSDAMIAVAAWCHGIPIVSYTVNRAIHPSDTGVNTTREFWEQHYAGVTLDDLPPADPSKFKFV